MDAQAPFFIVGCPRSGTTLLRSLLRSHPRLDIPSESHFMARFYRAWGDPPDERSRRRLVTRILELQWVRQFSTAGPDDFDGCATYREIIDRLFGLYARQNGAARWGDKTPAYAREIPTLSSIFPDAQFVHIIRDGRDVALSLKRVWFGFRHAHNAALWWRAHVRDARRDGPPLGPARYLEVRYEDLLADPGPVMQQICAFLGEPYDARVLVPSPPPELRQARSKTATNVSSTRVVGENRDKWRSAMARRDLEVFEAAAGDLLAELGYERVTDGVRPGLLARVFWRGDDFVRRKVNRFVLQEWPWLRNDVRLLRSRVRGAVRSSLAGSAGAAIRRPRSG